MAVSIWAAVWSAVAPVSIPSSLVPSTDTSRPSKVDVVAIADVNVLAPANVCVSVVTIPEAVALALGIVTLVPVDELMVGPAVSPAVADKFVVAVAASIVIDPGPFVIVTFEPAVSVALDRVLPVVLPISS